MVKAHAKPALNNWPLVKISCEWNLEKSTTISNYLPALFSTVILNSAYIVLGSERSHVLMYF